MGERPGSFQSCSIRNRLDYIFVSHGLAPLVTGGGLERRGLWGDPANIGRPTKWEAYGDLLRSEDATSDHAAIYIDVAI